MVNTIYSLFFGGLAVYSFAEIQSYFVVAACVSVCVIAATGHFDDDNRKDEAVE